MINYLKDETDTNNITNKKDVDEISFADIAGQYCGIASNITISENGSYTCGTGIRNEGSGKAKLIENKDGHYQLELVGDCAGVYDLYFNANASDMPTDISNLNPSYPTNILHNTSNDQYYVIQNLQ